MASVFGRADILRATELADPDINDIIDGEESGRILIMPGEMILGVNQKCRHLGPGLHR